MHRTFTLILFYSTLLLACNPDSTDQSVQTTEELATEISFDQEKWRLKKGEEYPFREQMLKDIVYNDTVRKLSKEELIALLGEPNKINEGHLYYRISQTKLGFWTLHTKTMVVKLSEDTNIEWIKIHE